MQDARCRGHRSTEAVNSLLSRRRRTSVSSSAGTQLRCDSTVVGGTQGTVTETGLHRLKAGDEQVSPRPLTGRAFWQRGPVMGRSQLEKTGAVMKSRRRWWHGPIRQPRSRGTAPLSVVGSPRSHTEELRQICIWKGKSGFQGN